MSKHITQTRPRVSLLSITVMPLSLDCLQYMCMGYSLHADRLKNKQRTATEHTSDSIDLPYCEGIQVVEVASFSVDGPRHVCSLNVIECCQVVMATETQRSPMLQTEASQESESVLILQHYSTA